MSNSPCVGCSWAPSPALITEHLQILREQVGAARGLVPHDHHVDAHGLDVLGRVDKGLALGKTAAGGGEVERVGPQPPCRQGETGLRARGILEKKIAACLAGQGDDLCGRACIILTGEDAAENRRLVEDQRNFLGREVFQSQEVPPRPERRRLAQFFQNGRFCRHDNLPQEVNFACIGRLIYSILSAILGPTTAPRPGRTVTTTPATAGGTAKASFPARRRRARRRTR